MRGALSATLSAILDGLAEVGYRLWERGAAQRLITSLTPPLNRGVGQPRLREMMRQHFRLRIGGRSEAVAQNFGHASMQKLTLPLQQVLVGRVLDECVLETVIGFGRQVLHQGCRLRRASPARFEATLRPSGRQRVEARKRSRVRSRPRSAPPRAQAELIQSCGQQLLQCRRDRLDAALFATFQQQPRHLFDEQRYTPSPFGHAVNEFLRKRVAGC